MLPPILSALVAGALLTASASAQRNLIPNWNFASETPLQNWRVDFPNQDTYKNNAGYVKQTIMEGKRCAVIELPAGTAGGKIETALVPAVPGATYRAEAEALLPDFGATIETDAYGADPRDEGTSKSTDLKGGRSPGLRIPEGDGHPALIMVHQAPVHEAPRAKKWVKIEREFTLPATGMAVGKPVKPIFLTMKAIAIDPTKKSGKAYFTDFKLTKLKDPPAIAGPAPN